LKGPFLLSINVFLPTLFRAMNNESSDFPDDFSDDSTDDFLKEFPEWDTDFNPWEFGSMMPNVGIPSEFLLSPWRELHRQLFLFLIHVLPPDYHQLSVAEEPDEEIEKRCDDWIRTFVNAPTRKGIVPPADVRKWASVRARRALINSEFESIQEEEYAQFENSIPRATDFVSLVDFFGSGPPAHCHLVKQ
jgi:hypothetical protein